MIPKSYVSDMFSVWMQFIRDPESIPPEFLKITEINEAMQELQYVIQDKEVRAEYEARMREIYDYNSGVTNAVKAEKRESARTALTMGLTIEQVSKITGLSVEEINDIRKKIQ